MTWRKDLLKLAQPEDWGEDTLPAVPMGIYHVGVKFMEFAEAQGVDHLLEVGWELEALDITLKNRPPIIDVSLIIGYEDEWRKGGEHAIKLNPFYMDPRDPDLSRSVEVPPSMVDYAKALEWILSYEYVKEEA